MDKILDGKWNAKHYDSNIGYVSCLGKGVVDLLAPRGMNPSLIWAVERVSWLM